MAGAISSLYEPMLERDADAIRAAAWALHRSEGPDALYEAVARFSVLAYAPTQHARHALIASLAVADLRTLLGARFADAVIECALYAAESRLPWSEPPLLDPPDPGEGPHGLDALRTAVEQRDRLACERWLTANLNSPRLVADLFTIASEDAHDLGHRTIVAVTAVRLAGALGAKGRFAALRVALWESCATAGTPATRDVTIDRSVLLAKLVAAFESSRGDLVIGQAVQLFDAALQAERLGADAASVARMLGSIECDEVNAATSRVVEPPPPVYPYARDRAGYLEASAVAARLEEKYGASASSRIRAAAYTNLVGGEELGSWSFA
jgi:hypothetical protein